MKRIYIFFSLLSLLSWGGFSQYKEKLNTRYQTYTQGNVLIIGNNILNRQAPKNNSNTDYNEISGRSNADFYMEYIDIDKDKNTFSSSTATLIPPTKRPHILFAGLYWAATYPFELGEKQGKEFIAKDNTRKNFDNVLLKLPKRKDYIEISGEILFDGGVNFNHLNKSPYVAFADITPLVQNLKRVDGQYTIANVTATRGYIQGGSSAGWAIVMVYEDEEEPMQRIEIKDGFVEITQNHNMVHFTDFQTPNTPESEARITGIALGADASVGQNKMAIYTDKAGVYLETDTRKVTSFFNSSITDGEDYLPKRMVNSHNTLGFDVFSTDVPNFENVIIPTGTTAIDVDIISEKDNFYLCVLGLTIESIKNPVIKSKEQEISFLEKNEEPSSKVSEKQEEKSAPKKDIVLSDNQSVIHSAQEELPSNLRKIAIKDVQKGFYTILGAYSTPENADRFIQTMKKKGVSANKFFYPDKKLYYIYNSYSASYNDALKKQMEFIKSKQSKADLKNTKDPWIFFVEN